MRRPRYASVRPGVIFGITPPCGRIRPMKTILFQTFGSVDLRLDGVRVRSVLTQPKRLALLAYLATASPTGVHGREALLALFWPESDDERARNALRQSLHYLRRSLGDGVVVGHGDREVGVDRARIRCDAVQFDGAIAEGRPAEALDLYQGEFLAGLHVEGAPGAERWLEERRTHYARAAVTAARTAARDEEARGGAASAALILRRALAISPCDEPTIRSLLELHERTGARTEALRDFEAFAERLGAEMGLEPSAETRAIAERIAAPRPPARSPEAPPPATSSAAEQGASPPLAATPPAGAPAPDPPPAAHAVPPTGPAPVPAPVSPASPTRGRLRRPGAASMAAAAVVVTLAAAFFVLPGLRSPAAESGAVEPVDARAAVAVLPFANLSGDPTQEFLADGVAEELMTALARVPGLSVVARTSAFSFKGQAVGVDSIGRALRVGYVVDGSVRMTRDRVRVTAQLVDVASGYQVWGETFEGPLADVFSVQDSIARTIVQALRPSLAAGEPGLPPTPAGDPLAHADVLRGVGALGLDSPQGFALAAGFFRRALEREPDHPRALAGLAQTRAVDAYRRVVSPDEGYAEARRLAERALELDPTLSLPHVVLGRIAADHDWDFDRSEHHYRRALDLVPGDVSAIRGLARLMAHMGRGDEAVALARRSLELDPVSPLGHRWLGSTYTLTGRHEEAVETLAAALALAPGNDLGRTALALSLSALGRHAEAVAAAELTIEALPDDQMMISHGAVVNAAAGNVERARELLAALEALPLPAHYYRAMIHGALGETDRAFELLDRAVAEREALLRQVGAMPAFASLRADPRFARVLQQVGLSPEGPAGRR